MGSLQFSTGISWPFLSSPHHAQLMPLLNGSDPHIQTLVGSVEQEPSLLEKLKSGVQKTRAGLVTALEDALRGKKQIDADLLDELESTLIAADIGVRTTSEILESIRQRVGRHQLADAAELKNLIREH